MPISVFLPFQHFPGHVNEKEEEETCGFGDLQAFKAKRKDATKNHILTVSIIPRFKLNVITFIVSYFLSYKF